MIGLILAHPDQAELMGHAYSALAGLAGYKIDGMCYTEEELRRADVGPENLLVIDATLAGSADEAADLIASLGAVRVVLILPPAWKSHRFKLDNIDVLASFTAPADWHAVASELKRHAQPAGEPSESKPEVQPAAKPEPEPVHVPAPGRIPRPAPRPVTPRYGVAERRTCAVWAGHAGGTGRTTLALALGILAAERGVDVSLVALSEPSLSAYLHLSRMPNVMDFAQSKLQRQDLLRTERSVVWSDGHDTPALRVLLGPTRPREGKLDRKQIGQVIEAVRAAHTLVIVDLPPLVPGGNAWSLEPLLHATDVVLVMAPTVAGVSAAVESLATLHDLGVAATVHLLLNRRLPGGLPAREFCDGVEQVWGTCPPVVAEVPFLPEMPALTSRGELPNLVLGDTPLGKAIAACGEVAVGLPRPVVDEEAGEAPVQGKAPVERQGRSAKEKRGLGKLFTLEVVD
jgi:MinD-like ATPase involved in chromosome partitioning or flagellar assembly